MNEKRREYYAITAKDRADEVNKKIKEYSKKYNILEVLNAARSNNPVEPEARTESQKIVRYLWERGFSYEKIVELLGLKDDFEQNYLPTVTNQEDQSDSAEASSSSAAPQTRKRKADQKVQSSVSKKQKKRR